MADLRRAVNQAIRNATARTLSKLPSPGNPDAEQGEDCGCARRKEKMIQNLKNGKTAGEIVKEALADIRGK